MKSALLNRNLFRPFPIMSLVVLAVACISSRQTPLLPTSYYGRAYLYEEQGKKELAIADYKRFLELSTDAMWLKEAEARLKALQEP